MNFHFLHRRGMALFLAGVLAVSPFYHSDMIAAVELTDSVSVNPEEGDMANSFRYQNGEPISSANISKKASSVAWSEINGVFVNDKGKEIPNAVAKGVDVSHHQGAIDWLKVKNSDVDFAIIRCGYGQDMTSQDDKYWTANADACTKNHIPFGTYLYSYATTKEKAIGEANHVLRLVKGYDLQYPIYYDLEDKSLEGLSASQLAAIAKAFCDTIEAAGYKAAIYANKYWFTTKLTNTVFDHWDRWVAEYNSTCSYTKPYTMWQCTSKGSVPGISGNTDLNFIVQSEPLVSVTSIVFDSEIEMKNGETASMEVTVLPRNAFHKGITYHSDNDAVASVDENGMITAHQDGKVTITVQSEENTAITAACTVTVSEQPSASPTQIPYISESPAVTQTPDISESPTVTQTPDISESPTVTQTPDISESPIITEQPIVSPTQTAEVTNLPDATPTQSACVTETPIPTLNADITETPSTVPLPTIPVTQIPTITPTQTADMEPTNTPIPTETPKEQITLEKSSVILKNGKSTTLKAEIQSDKTIQWSSSNTSVVSVSQKGKITGKKPGKATITAAIPDEGAASCTVYVKPSAVSGTDFTAKSSSELTLTWKKVSGASGYSIYRYDSTKEKDVLVKNVSSSTTSYTFSKLNGESGSKLTAGSKHTYKVAAYKTIDDTKYYGSKTSIKTATKPKKTTVKKFKKKNSTTINLKWSKITASDGYIIYISNDQTSNYHALRTIDNPKVTSYTISKLSKGKTYYVKLCTYRKINGKIVYSSYSNTKKVKL